MADRASRALDMLTRVAQDGAAQVQANFDSYDDDWIPMLMAVDARGRVSVVGVEGPHAGIERTLWHRAVTRQLRSLRATAVAMLASTWQLSNEDAAQHARGESGYDTIAEHPRRREALYLTVMSAGETRAYSANIERFDHQPPQLGPWQDLNRGLSAGGLHDALRDGLTRG